MDFSKLASLFPKAEFPAAIREVVGVSTKTGRHESFVEPKFSQPENLEASKILLVAAPAAVGKTTVARELAARNNGLFWDLSRQGVAANAFVGMITNVFGWGKPGETIQRLLREGKTLFILDALDEAIIQAGFDNFVGFLGDITMAMTKAADRPQVILLGRTDAVEIAELILLENDVPYCRTSIEFFDREKSCEFIDVGLDARFGKRKSLPHRTNRMPFESARDGLLRHAAAALGQEYERAWETDGRRFLGYAPVLQAFADFLHEENYQKLGAHLESVGKSAAHDHWTFLREIVENLVTREQEKVVGQVRKGLASHTACRGWDGWAGLYGKNEQMARITCGKLNTAFDDDLVPIPEPLRQVYEKRIQEQVKMHPFVGDGPDNFASVVFRDYLIAWGLTSGHHLAADLRGLAIRSTLPSPLLARFAFQMGDAADPICRPEDVGLYLDSLGASATVGHEAGVVVENTASGEETVCFQVGEDEEPPMTLVGGGDLTFYRSLAKATIVTERTIVVGGRSPTFILGPDVDVEAGRIDFKCDSLNVRGDRPVRLIARAGPKESPQRITVVGSTASGSLQVRWPGMAYPWTSYRAATADMPPFTTHPDWVVLRKLLLMFRTQRSRREDRLRTSRWTNAEIVSGARDRILELAFSHGVLSKKEHPPVLIFSTDFADLRDLLLDPGKELTPRSRAFVDACLA